MYIIALSGAIFKNNPEEINYLGWQRPGWEDNGYFWTSKETIEEMIRDDYVSGEHPFLFETEKQAKELAEKIGLTTYRIVRWN